MKSVIIGAVAVSVLMSTSAIAQQAGTQVNHGAAIPGVCIYNAQGVLARSTAGQALATGLQRLAEEVRGELQPYATSIQSEQQQLQQQVQAGQQPDQTRVQAYQQRLQEAGQLEQTRQNELRYTELMQTQVIGQAAQPIIAAAYQEKGCSILIERSAVLVGNPEMDITETVIQRLNQALPTISFNRMAVPAEAQQQQ